MTHTIAKYLVISSIFIGLLTVKIGVMRGEADYILYPTGIESQTMVSTELLNNTPVETKNIRIAATITAYSSHPDQTDSTPNIAANGKLVFQGLAACPRDIPFDTKIKIAGKTYICGDRMHKRFDDRFDIWFSDTNAALRFGVRTANVEIL